MDLLCDVSLLCRIATRRMEVLSSTGFSLCGLSGGQSTEHRLKPVLLDRAGPPVAASDKIGRESPQSSCGKFALDRRPDRRKTKCQSSGEREPHGRAQPWAAGVPVLLILKFVAPRLEFSDLPGGPGFRVCVTTCARNAFVGSAFRPTLWIQAHARLKAGAT